MVKRAHDVPDDYDPSRFPRFAVTVDIVILTMREQSLHVLLVQRGVEPFAGFWALPGGFKRPDETLDEAARRELREETGVTAPGHLAQFRAYGDPGRDERTNVVTVAYLAVMPRLDKLQSGTDAAAAQLWPVDDARRLKLAFDHNDILSDALSRAANELEQTDLATKFVGDTFTLTDLQKVYEGLWHVKIDPANFRRSLTTSPATATSESYVESTGRRGTAAGDRGGRPPELFRVGSAWRIQPPLRRRPKERPGGN
ncbi:NUDIX hydrolase [Mycobacterium bourgelatii]|uniref:NUDIX hydrolase n=1 Tax=Mycobacterium bourgelatii TaxID=1273442 RepID=A0A7I9YXT7_MYCBU|nr:NUDIX domain-containing protein [Mycobacterium bourgelatii]MCV6973025.1 NUDIX hydrolase [Mycobacterium bourgelatii]GFG93445.1 NUDIX hydrolase [Mycobacterium bourgelatii]